MPPRKKNRTVTANGIVWTEITDVDTGIRAWLAEMPGGGRPVFHFNTDIGDLIEARLKDHAAPMPTEYEVWQADRLEQRVRDARRWVEGIPADFQVRATAENTLRHMEHLISHEGRAEAANTSAAWKLIWDREYANLVRDLMTAGWQARGRGRKKGPRKGGEIAGRKLSEATAEKYGAIRKAALKMTGKGHGYGEVVGLSRQLGIPERTIRRAISMTSKKDAAKK